MYFYYDKVRSAAVHGESVPVIDASEVIKFMWDTRRAVTQFVEFAQSRGFTNRRQVRTALDTHESRHKLATFLIEHDPRQWRRFFEAESEARRDESRTPD
jgi:hypothetical protein